MNDTTLPKLLSSLSSAEKYFKSMASYSKQVATNMVNAQKASAKIGSTNVTDSNSKATARKITGGCSG
jgi:hypothetical protein